MREIARISREERGIEDPEPLIATYRELIEKWHGLVKPLNPIRDNPQPYADLLRQEIYSKIDLDNISELSFFWPGTQSGPSQEGPLLSCLIR